MRRVRIPLDGEVGEVVVVEAALLLLGSAGLVQDIERRRTGHHRIAP